MRIDPRSGFGRVYRQSPPAPDVSARAPGAGALHDVTDVEPKAPRS
jgi:hypothetical protein